jgi:hypothetical protein
MHIEVMYMALKHKAILLKRIGEWEKPNQRKKTNTNWLLDEQ